MELDPVQFSNAVVAIYELVGEGGGLANAARVNRLLAALTGGAKPSRGSAPPKNEKR